MNYYDWEKTINGKTQHTTNYSTTDTRDDAIEWLVQNQHDQFFLWLAFNSPHIPYHKPPNDLHMYPNLLDIDPKEYGLNVLPWSLYLN